MKFKVITQETRSLAYDYFGQIRKIFLQNSRWYRVKIEVCNICAVVGKNSWHNDPQNICHGNILLRTTHTPMTLTMCTKHHYNDVIVSAMASQITSLTIIYSTFHSRRSSKKTSNLRVTGFCVGNSPVILNSPHKGPVTRKCFHLMTLSWWK